MFTERLKNYRIVLASGSPRRQQLLEEMGIPFEVRLKPVDEVYPTTLKAAEIADYLAQLKATAFKGTLAGNEILITSDTVVWFKNRSYAKAGNEALAFKMIKTLSGKWHQVITSVCFTTSTDQITKHGITEVKFRKLEDAEIRYYIEHFKPFDKAGAYGIQEWLGLIGIEAIRGSYTNVVGFPTHLVYKTLMDMAK
ncbi:MAG: Maf-like protein [Flavobacteriaceae bacterium]